jgi:hypothetical protein
METLELSQIDTRYEGLRLRNAKQEQALFFTIKKMGIQEPLDIIKSLEEELFILVNGYKRYRIAKELNIEIIPVNTLDTRVIPGLIKYIKLSDNRSISQIEQACLVDELNNRHGLDIVDIAKQLERSPSWVRIRLGILEEMEDSVRERIMSGEFPFRNYMYSLRKRTRVRQTAKVDISQFVEKTAGKGLSTRDIDILSKGYFSGNKNLKIQIDQGKLDWTLKQLKMEEQTKQAPATDCNEYETKALSQLDWVFGLVNRVPLLLSDNRFENLTFFKKGTELSSKILTRTDSFISSLQEFYDRSSKASGCDSTK